MLFVSSERYNAHGLRRCDRTRLCNTRPGCLSYFNGFAVANISGSEHRRIMQEPGPTKGDETYGGMTAGQLNTVVLGVLGVVVAGVCGWLFLFNGIDTVTGKKDVDQTAFVAQQVANGAILKVSDLPEGWKATVSGEDEGPDIDFEWSEGCKFLERDTSIAEIAGTRRSRPSGNCSSLRFATTASTPTQSSSTSLSTRSPRRPSAMLPGPCTGWA